MSEGKKYDGEKPRMHLLPPKSMAEVAKVLTFGAKKYDEHNWRKLENLQNRYTSGALRHIFAHNDGEQLDDESDLSHLAHAICCLLFKLEIELENGKSKEEKLREPNGCKSGASDSSFESDLLYSKSYYEEGSVRDSKYSIQYDQTDKSSGGL